MELDNKLVGSWQELGFLACDDERWEDAVRYLDHAVILDPMDSPIVWYFSGLAYYNLGRLDQAERSVRAELKLDHGENPRANFLLGLVLIARKDPEGGAQALRSFIAAAPTSPDVASARKELSRLERQHGN
jgi:Flp pilus assembly protein TadD